MNREEVKINLDKLELELAVIPEQIYDTMYEIFNYQGQLKETEQEIEDYSGTLSNKITLNPEKYGFPIGTAVERFKVKACIMADKKYQKLNSLKINLELKIKKLNIDLEALKAKKEILECLIKSR